MLMKPKAERMKPIIKPKKCTKILTSRISVGNLNRQRMDISTFESTTFSNSDTYGIKGVLSLLSCQAHYNLLLFVK